MRRWLTLALHQSLDKPTWVRIRAGLIEKPYLCDWQSPKPDRRFHRISRITESPSGWIVRGGQIWPEKGPLKEKKCSCSIGLFFSLLLCELPPPPPVSEKPSTWPLPMQSTHSFPTLLQDALRRWTIKIKMAEMPPRCRCRKRRQRRDPTYGGGGGRRDQERP